MGRMSARFIARERGETTQNVYKTLQDMGFVHMDEHGTPRLTPRGEEAGGKLSRNGTPTFDFDSISEMMSKFKE